MLWTKIAQKGYFKSRTDEHGYRILDIRSLLGTKFHSKQFWILAPNLPKKVISSQKEKKWTPLNST